MRSHPENFGELFKLAISDKLESDIHFKRKLLSSIFPEKMIFSKKNSRTPRINEAIRVILNTDMGFGRNKKGQLFKNIELSRKVELQGIVLLYVM